MQFDSDNANRQHIAKHKVTPEEVEEVFGNTYFDLEFIPFFDEERFSVIGRTNSGRILIVWSTWRGDAICVQ